MLPEVARVAESPAMADASPAARWIMNILCNGEWVDVPVAVEASPAGRTKRRRAKVAAVDRQRNVIKT
jgi:hypothetical protein